MKIDKNMILFSIKGGYLLKLLKNIFNKNKTKDLTYINKMRNITKESVKNRLQKRADGCKN